jgi:S-adenosylmethionine:tRNA ribosyltransferase-isomerase
VTRLSDYDYVLPEAAIAQKPIEPRDASKLLVLNSGAISHSSFRELPVFL